MLTVLTNDNDSMSSSHTPPPRSPLPSQPTNDSVSLGSPHKRPSQPRSNSSYSIMKGKFNRKIVTLQHQLIFIQKIKPSA